MKQVLRALSLTSMMLLLAGCASLGGGNISTNNPDAYGDAQITMMSNKDVVGKEAMLGGMISTINTQNNQVRIEAVLYELDRDGYPLRNRAFDNVRLVVNIPGQVRTNGYSPGDYFTAVGLIQSADNVTIGGDNMRVIILEASDYQFWRDPRRDPYYYDDFHFNSPAIRFGHYNPYWGVGFGPYYPYY